MMNPICKLLAPAIAGIVALGASAASAETKLVFGYGLSETSVIAAEGIIPWLKAVEEGTNGEIKTEFYGGGSIVTFPTVLQNLQGGLLDASILSALSYRKEIPANVLLSDLGGALQNRFAALAAATEVMIENCPECASELEPWNAVPLSAWTSEPYDLVCKEPVNSPEDITGRRIRANAAQAKVTVEMGATPVNVAVTEVYESLQRGVIDCAIVDVSWLRRFSLHEVATQVMRLRAGLVVSTSQTAIRADWWRERTPEQKRVMIDAMPASLANEIFAERVDVDAAESTYGDKIAFVDAPDWAKEALERASSQVVSEAIANAKAAGVANAQEIADAFMASYDKWLAVYETAPSEEELAAFLAETFYSKYMPE